MERKLEICVDNIESALAAQEGGADRIELCAALGVGGVTPSSGFIKMAKKLLKIPVFMIVRPRAGNFIYNPEEIEIMVEDIHIGLDLKVNGFVTGALSNDGSVNIESCTRLIEAANGLPVTFHRAFDLTYNDQALFDAINLGFKRILTSGRCKTALKGCATIKDLVLKAKSNIIIMPGSGISPVNLQDIINATGALEYHSSGQLKHPSSVVDEIVGGTTFSPLTSTDVVRNIKSILKANTL